MYENVFLATFYDVKDGGENFEKKIWNKKNFFWKKLICEKVTIYHKMSMSWVYENVFQTPENYS